MHIDWTVVSCIAAPVVALFAGIWINRWFGNRAKLISYFGHVSTHRIDQPNAPVLVVNTHAVVLRNIGRQAATNVRLSHHVLPDFNIWPPIQYHVQALASGGSEIVIPSLVPNEQITISYLYFGPQTVSQINAGIKCDQGFAQPIPVILQRQYPSWFNKLVVALFLVGAVSILYVTYDYGLLEFLRLVR